MSFLLLVDLAGAWLLGSAVASAFDGPGAVPVAVVAVLAAVAALLMLCVAVSWEPSVVVGHLLVVLAGGVLAAAPGLALSLVFHGAVARVLVGASIALGVWRSLAGAGRRISGRKERNRDRQRGGRPR